MPCGRFAHPQHLQDSAACAIPASAKEHTMKITTPTPAATSRAHAISFSYLAFFVPLSFHIRTEREYHKRMAAMQGLGQ
jgi:hypothetical protein